MKQNEKTNRNAEVDCKPSSCLECFNCYAVNFEEARKIAPAVKHESSQLYDAEALSYYFYFLPAVNRA